MPPAGNARRQPRRGHPLRRQGAPSGTLPTPASLRRSARAAILSSFRRRPGRGSAPSRLRQGRRWPTSGRPGGDRGRAQRRPAGPARRGVVAAPRARPAVAPATARGAAAPSHPLPLSAQPSRSPPPPRSRRPPPFATTGRRAGQRRRSAAGRRRRPVAPAGRAGCAGCLASRRAAAARRRRRRGLSPSSRGPKRLCGPRRPAPAGRRAEPTAAAA